MNRARMIERMKTTIATMILVVAATTGCSTVKSAVGALGSKPTQVTVVNNIEPQPVVVNVQPTPVVVQPAVEAKPERHATAKAAAKGAIAGAAIGGVVGYVVGGKKGAGAGAALGAGAGAAGGIAASR